jgi:hypothetical protein
MSAKDFTSHFSFGCYTYLQLEILELLRTSEIISFNSLFYSEKNKAQRDRLILGHTTNTR